MRSSDPRTGTRRCSSSSGILAVTLGPLLSVSSWLEVALFTPLCRWGLSGAVCVKHFKQGMVHRMSARSPPSPATLGGSPTGVGHPVTFLSTSQAVATLSSASLETSVAVLWRLWGDDTEGSWSLGAPRLLLASYALGGRWPRLLSHSRVTRAVAREGSPPWPPWLTLDGPLALAVWERRRPCGLLCVSRSRFILLLIFFYLSIPSSFCLHSCCSFSIHAFSGAGCLCPVLAVLSSPRKAPGFPSLPVAQCLSPC